MKERGNRKRENKKSTEKTEKEKEKENVRGMNNRETRRRAGSMFCCKL
jgi:hypothetical protein